jgi:hypothetical protein
VAGLTRGAAGGCAGGQPGVDQGRGEVRPHQGLPLLHVRPLVDPAGHHPGSSRKLTDHPLTGTPLLSLPWTAPTGRATPVFWPLPGMLTQPCAGRPRPRAHASPGGPPPLPSGPLPCVLPGCAVLTRGVVCAVQVHMYEAITKVYRAKRLLADQLGRPATAAEIGELCGFPAEKVHLCLQVNKPIMSTDRESSADRPGKKLIVRKHAPPHTVQRKETAATMCRGTHVLDRPAGAMQTRPLMACVQGPLILGTTLIPGRYLIAGCSPCNILAGQLTVSETGRWLVEDCFNPHHFGPHLFRAEATSLPPFD